MIRTIQPGRRSLERALLALVQPRVWWVALGAVVLLGTLARLWLLVRANWMLDGDEATMALVARHIQTRDERPIFFPGQAYMGVLQAYLAAILFELFGVSRQAAKVVPLVSSAAFVATTALLARRVYTPAVGIIAGVLAALPSLYLISTTLRISYPLIDVMALGNVILLIAIDSAWRYPSNRSLVRRMLVIGLMAGLGFWLHSAIVMYLLPAGLLLLLRWPTRSLVIGAPVALLGFIVGAAPVFQHARHHDYTLFDYLLGRGESVERDFTGVTKHLIESLLPRYLGVSVPWQEAPLVWQVAVFVPTVAALLLLVVRSYRAPVAWLRLRPQGTHPEVVLLLFGATVLATYVLSRFSVYAVMFPTTDATGRYIAPLGTLIPIALAGAAHHVWQRGKAGNVVAVAGITLVLAGTLATYASTDHEQVFQSPYYRQLPADLDPLIAELDDLGVVDVWVDHWIGTPLMFDADERIAAADYIDVWVAGGIGRLYDTNIRVYHAENTAYVFRTDAPSVSLERTLRERGIEFEARSIDGFRIVHPTSETVHPESVVDDLLSPE